jgi:hypothetical protein
MNTISQSKTLIATAWDGTLIMFAIHGANSDNGVGGDGIQAFPGAGPRRRGLRSRVALSHAVAQPAAYPRP